jgi:hypothetical protein
MAYLWSFRTFGKLVAESLWQIILSIPSAASITQTNIRTLNTLTSDHVERRDCSPMRCWRVTHGRAITSFYVARRQCVNCVVIVTNRRLHSDTRMFPCKFSFCLCLLKSLRPSLALQCEQTVVLDFCCLLSHFSSGDTPFCACKVRWELSTVCGCKRKPNIYLSTLTLYV